MDKETMRRLFQQQQEGFRLLHAHEVEEWRKATFEDRVRGFANLMAFIRRFSDADHREARMPDPVVIARWQAIRERAKSQLG
jgi:hypothetical protein